MMSEKAFKELPDGLAQSLSDMLTGGNHLASVLIGRLDVFPAYTENFTNLYGDDLDLWLAWRGIMRLRDKLMSLGLYE